MQDFGPGPGAWRKWLYTIIFEADTPGGKLFDLLLIVSIALSVIVVMLSTVQGLDSRFGDLFDAMEWTFTGLFTLEYLLRLLCVNLPKRYAKSFFGVVDLLAVAPTYLAVVLPAGEFFLMVRVLRMLRVFRVLKLMQYVGESHSLMRAMLASRHKIAVFLYFVSVLTMLFGAAMYVIEGAASGFTSIPVSIYWAVVTLTTVGYGDISPITPLGQAVASIIMIMGYAIIAVPTGIVTSEMTREARGRSIRCPGCGVGGHGFDADFCRRCGYLLSGEEN